MISILYHVWLMKATSRKDAATDRRKIPAWGLGAWLASYIVAIRLSLWFCDRGWLYFRELFSTEEHINRSNVAFEAYERGFRSLYEYNNIKYLLRKHRSRHQRLLQANALPALPEGRESALAREIDRIETESNRGCGGYFELYQAWVLHKLRALNSTLTEYDRLIFNRLLFAAGWDISDESYEVARQGEDEAWAEIRADCE